MDDDDDETVDVVEAMEVLDETEADDELEVLVDELAVELLEVVVLISVRLDEYFRVILVTFTRRYSRVALLGGGSAR